MKKMSVLVLMALFAFSDMASAALISVNLGNATSPSATGFDDWRESDGVNLKGKSKTIGDITVEIVAGGRVINRGDSYEDSDLGNLTQAWWGIDSSTVPFELKVTGLASGTLEWTSWHYDNNDQTALMDISVSTDGGLNWTLMKDDFRIANKTNGVTPPNPATFSFTSNGSDAVHVQFLNLTHDGGSNKLTVLNGFSIIPEPASGLLLIAGAMGLGLLRKKIRG